MTTSDASPDDTAARDSSAEDSRAEAIENAAFVLALRARATRDTAVLRAMEQVPRAAFAPAAHRDLARRDLALPLPCGASMTAPSLVARMLAALAVPAGASVLEIGTGSGYVTALLARLGAARVVSLERYATLAEAARTRLAGLPVEVRQADGLAAAPGAFARILVHGSVPALPAAWAAALEPGGRLVAGLAGGESCRLLILERNEAGTVESAGLPARLAPLVAGVAQVL